MRKLIPIIIATILLIGLTDFLILKYWFVSVSDSVVDSQCEVIRFNQRNWDKLYCDYVLLDVNSGETYSVSVSGTCYYIGFEMDCYYYQSDEDKISLKDPTFAYKIFIIIFMIALDFILFCICGLIIGAIRDKNIVKNFRSQLKLTEASRLL